jgi:hypothetical protein
MALFAKSFLPTLAAETKVAEAKQLVDKIHLTIGFALDSGGKIEHQWSTTCGWKAGNPFREWFVQALKQGRIQLVVPAFPEQHKKKLRIDLGFPDDRFEQTYIGVANVTTIRYIVTEDMHFFEPKHKDADEQTKRRSRDERQGSVCRFLRRHMNIRVGMPAHAWQELWNSSPTKVEGQSDSPDWQDEPNREVSVGRSDGEETRDAGTDPFVTVVKPKD